MYASGVMEIQSHTYDLHYKALITKGKKDTAIKGPLLHGEVETDKAYRERVANDLLKNKALIEEKVGNNVVSFAYPFGMYSEKSEDILESIGYEMTLSIKNGVNTLRSGPYLPIESTFQQA